LFSPSGAVIAPSAQHVHFDPFPMKSTSYANPGFAYPNENTLLIQMFGSNGFPPGRKSYTASAKSAGRVGEGQ
jgi:hypothetical protein